MAEGSESRLGSYLRGIVGGLIFALPMLFTREIWFAGFLPTPLRLLTGVVVAFGLVVAFNFVSGIGQDQTLPEILRDAVEEFAIGVAVATTVLYLTHRIGDGESWRVTFPTILIGAMSTCLGVSVGASQLGKNPEKLSSDRFLVQLILAGAGAIIVAANIAPTQEVPTMAAESTALRLLGLLVFTFAVIIAVIQAGNLRGVRSFSTSPPVPGHLFGVIATCAVGFGSAALMLWFFGRFDGEGPTMIVRQTVVLGAPAAIGSSIGRAILQG